MRYGWIESVHVVATKQHVELGGLSVFREPDVELRKTRTRYTIEEDEVRREDGGRSAEMERMGGEFGQKRKEI